MLRTIVAIVCLSALTACGLKGPLYLPEDAAAVKNPAPIVSAPVQLNAGTKQ